MNSSYEDEVAKCLTPLSRLSYENLDTNIAHEERNVHKLEVSLREAKAHLAELQKVRKLVTPEDEGKIKALRSIGLV